MSANALVHVAPVFHVADLDKSIAYYRDRLGFDTEFVYGDFYAGMRRDGCHIHLRYEDSPQSEKAHKGDEQLDVYFKVMDAVGLASEFEKKGVRFLVPLREADYGKEFYVCDPDGNVLAFVEAAGDV